MSNFGTIATAIGLGITVITFIVTQVVQVRKGGEDKGRIITELEYIKKNVDKTNQDMGSRDKELRQKLKEDFNDFKEDLTKEVENSMKKAKRELRDELKVEFGEDIKTIGDDVAILKSSVKKAHERIDKVVKEKNKVNKGVS